VVGWYDDPADVADVAVEGQRAYLAAANGIWVLDVSHRHDVGVIARFQPAWRAHALVARDNRLFVAAGADGMRVVDVAEASAPREIGSFMSHSEEGDGVSAIALAGTYAFLVHNVPPTPQPRPTRRAFARTADDALGRMIVVDVSDANHPRAAGELALPSRLTGIDVRDGLLVAVTTEGDIEVVDVTNPTMPRLSSSVAMSPPARAAILGRDKRMYVTADRRFSVVDLSEPNRPIELSSKLRERQLYAVGSNGRHAYVIERYEPRGPAGHAERLQNLDVADPEHPRDLSHVDTPALQAEEYRLAEPTMRMAVTDDRAFVAAQSNGLVTVGVSGFVQAFLPHCVR
jgi:hypothetical protein